MKIIDFMESHGGSFDPLRLVKGWIDKDSMVPNFTVVLRTIAS